MFGSNMKEPQPLAAGQGKRTIPLMVFLFETQTRCHPFHITQPRGASPFLRGSGADCRMAPAGLPLAVLCLLLVPCGAQRVLGRPDCPLEGALPSHWG